VLENVLAAFPKCGHIRQLPHSAFEIFRNGSSPVLFLLLIAKKLAMFPLGIINILA
jgi:hypothetical protein